MYVECAYILVFPLESTVWISKCEVWSSSTDCLVLCIVSWTCVFNIFLVLDYIICYITCLLITFSGSRMHKRNWKYHPISGSGIEILQTRGVRYNMGSNPSMHSNKSPAKTHNMRNYYEIERSTRYISGNR